MTDNKITSAESSAVEEFGCNDSNNQPITPQSSKSGLQLNARNILILAATAAVFTVFFGAVIFRGNIPYTGDFWTMSLPWKQFIYKSVSENSQIPTYNPFVFCGVPFLSNIQTGAFYPVDIVFYFIEPLAAFKITFFLFIICSCTTQ